MTRTWEGLGWVWDMIVIGRDGEVSIRMGSGSVGRTP
jgi:hypothetical protein